MKRYFQRFHTFAMNRMVPLQASERDSLAYWRARILFALVFTGLLAGLLVFVPVIAMAVKEGLWALLIFDGTGWLIGLGILLIPGPSYFFRATIALLITYSAGVFIIVSVGPLSGGPAWLFAFAILSGVLLGSRAAVIALIVNALTLMIMGWAISTGLLGQTFLFFRSMERMVTAGVNFLFLNSIAAIAVANLVKGLISANRKERDLTYKLKSEQSRLIEIKDQLEKEIEEHRRADEAWTESERQLRTIIQHSSELFYIHDTGHVLTYVSPTSLDILGYTPEEMKAQWTELATDNPINTEGLVLTKKAIETGRRQSPHLLELKRKDGTFTLLEIDESPVKNSSGRVVAISGAARDVTLQKRAEERVKESEQRFRDLFNAISDVIFTLDLDGRFRSVNPALCQAFGYDEGELIGRKVSDFMKPEFAPAFESEYLAQLKELGYQEGTAVYFTKERQKIYIEYRCSIVRPYHGDPYISGTGKNVTEKILSKRRMKKLREQFEQAQKMQAIGTLAGGIAHNVNNVLMGIQGRASLMMLKMDDSSPEVEHLKSIEEYVKSAADLTKQLLGFARGGKYEIKATDLNRLVEESADMFGRTKKETVIHVRIQEDIWTVEADQSQIEQVLMNLYVNAWQAMPGGGDLHIQTENVVIDESYIRPFEVVPGRYVKVSVTDTGVGMDEDTRQRIFDPFFTTKGIGAGTGLGLASAYGIIKNHGGFINVYSEKGVGSTFNIYLPVSDKEFVEGEQGTGKVHTGEGTILLVDDEDMILDVSGELLKNLGYTVIAAKCGDEAVDLYEKNRELIDIVILDMVMPGMGGGETFDRLKEMSPDIKVLLSSGYSINGRAQEILDRGCNGFIQKPFNMEELSLKIKTTLDQ